MGFVTVALFAVAPTDYGVNRMVYREPEYLCDAVARTAVLGQPVPLIVLLSKPMKRATDIETKALGDVSHGTIVHASRKDRLATRLLLGRPVTRRRAYIRHRELFAADDTRFTWPEGRVSVLAFDSEFIDRQFDAATGATPLRSRGGMENPA